MRRLVLVTVPVLAAAALGCGSWKRVGSEEQPRPTETLTRLLNTTQFYRGVSISQQPLERNFIVGVPQDYGVGFLSYQGHGATPDWRIVGTTVRYDVYRGCAAR